MSYNTAYYPLRLRQEAQPVLIFNGAGADGEALRFPLAGIAMLGDEDTRCVTTLSDFRKSFGEAISISYNDYGVSEYLLTCEC